MANPVTTRRAYLLLLAFCPPTAAAADTVQAVVAGRRYAVPRVLLDVPVASGGVATDILSMRLLWPGAVPVPPEHDTAYESGLIAVGVQDI